MRPEADRGRHASQPKPVYSDMSNNRAFPWAWASFPIILNPIASYPRSCRPRKYPEAQISFDRGIGFRVSPGNSRRYVRPIRTSLFSFLFVPRERADPRDKPGSYALSFLFFFSFSFFSMKHDNFTTLPSRRDRYHRRSYGPTNSPVVDSHVGRDSR